MRLGQNRITFGFKRSDLRIQTRDVVTGVDRERRYLVVAQIGYRVHVPNGTAESSATRPEGGTSLHLQVECIVVSRYRGHRSRGPAIEIEVRMCRPGGVIRCTMTHDKRHRENQRRAQGRAYRRALADVLTARGENELAKQVLKAPMSSLPGITTALGLAPENVAAGASGGVIPGTGTTHTTGPEDAALIGNVAATYTPSLSGIRDTVLHRERTAHLASLGTEVRAARRRAERERAMIRQATGPVAVFEQGQRHKDACLDLAVAQDRQAAHTETLFADIDAACRGTALVPPFTGDVSRPTGEVPDPVAAEPLAAMGLTEWTDRRTGHLKPMYPATVAARARRTATREPGPVDRRADQFLLADLAERSPGFTVTSFEGALGSDTASVEVDGVITDEQGAVAGVAVVSRCPGDWSHGQPPVRDRARALYVAHVAGRPVALCALIDGVPTTVTLQPGETIDGTVTGPTVASQLDPIAAFRTLTTAAANGETVGPSAYRRGPINAANKYAQL